MMDWMENPAAPRPPQPTTLEMKVDPRRWRQVRAICQRLTGRDPSDVECFAMIVEHYLMKQGLHTRGR